MRRQVLFTIASAFAVIFIGAKFAGKEPATKEELGELLFFDKILSRNKTISCSSCHIPGFAFADTAAVSTGVYGRKGNRNAPTTMNVMLHQTFLWDGRAASLEDQALEPIANPLEMDLAVEEAVIRLRKSKSYKAYFKKIFGTDPSKENLAAAIAAYERTLETSDSPFDRWKFGDEEAVSDAVKRGFQLFNGKGKCVKCHFGADLTANEFRNIGLFNGRELNDSGRISISKKAEDLGRFKTPSLRNIAVTAPYMHNGIIKSLEDVIDFYNETEKVIPNPINKDTLLSKPLELTVQEKRDLVSFLVSLTDKRFQE